VHSFLSHKFCHVVCEVLVDLDLSLAVTEQKGKKKKEEKENEKVYNCNLPSFNVAMFNANHRGARACYDDLRGARDREKQRQHQCDGHVGTLQPVEHDDLRDGDCEQ
jgi:hypothetical protein